MIDYLLTIAILILILTSLIEIFLSATWNKMYFTSGVPALVRNIPVNIHHSDTPSCILFNDKFESGCLDIPRSLRFNELVPNVYGFRESLIPIGRLAILHGVVVFDEENHQVTVKGFLDWTVLCFVLIWLIVLPLAWLLGFLTFDEPVWEVARLYFGVVFTGLVISYLSNYFRFSAVASFAAESWSRKSVNMVTG